MFRRAGALWQHISTWAEHGLIVEDFPHAMGRETCGWLPEAGARAPNDIFALFAGDLNHLSHHVRQNVMPPPPMDTGELCLVNSFVGVDTFPGGAQFWQTNMMLRQDHFELVRRSLKRAGSPTDICEADLIETRRCLQRIQRASP